MLFFIDIIIPPFGFFFHKFYLMYHFKKNILQNEIPLSSAKSDNIYDMNVFESAVYKNILHPKMVNSVYLVRNTL